MSTNDTCEVCGFQWSLIGRNDIAPRLTASVDSFIDVITKAGPKALLRPTPQRWSILEYGAHLRDVFLSIRGRFVTASILDESTGTPIFRDERVDLGFYKLDKPDDICQELAVVAGLFIRTFSALPDGFEQRQFMFSPVTPVKVTILWAGAQAVHESEHHLSDVRENLTQL
jgi:hypothetical protein